MGMVYTRKGIWRRTQEFERARNSTRPTSSTSALYKMTGTPHALARP